MDTLYLIDGHALIFKMYYAFLRKPMVNSKGADTSILYGFTKYILELLDRENPTHFAVAFDPPGGTFRNKMYPEYKANRTETPQLVIDALQPLTEICHALNIPTLMVPGFEADDVIGTVAKEQRREGKQVFMVTPDKDYGQLVEDGIFQVRPGKGGGDDEVLDSKAICEKYGIQSTSQVIDMLAICGDTADNVPGVAGVGPVGAAKLLTKFGTLEGIYEHIGELTPKQKAQFEAAKDHIDLSYELVTIKTDVPVEIPDMRVDKVYGPEIADLFEKYEFPSLMRYIGDVKATPTAPKKELSVRKVSPAELCATASGHGKVSVAWEADGDSIFSGIRGLSLAVSKGEEVIVASGSEEEFRSILEDSSIEKSGADLKKLRSLLRYAGVELRGKMLDVELMHYLLDPEKSHKTAILAKSYLGIDLEDIPSDGASLFEDTGALLREREASALPALAEAIAEDMEKASVVDLYDKMEQPLSIVLSDMEYTGVKVDPGQIRSFAEGLRKEMKEHEATVRELAGEPELNVSSPKQIGEVLFEKMQLDPRAKKSAKGSWSTDETTLREIEWKSPIVGEILEYRATKKLLSTYIEPLPGYISPVTGRIHTTFNQTLTSTGRLSSSNPNLQNIPIRTERGKEIRKAFVGTGADGVITSADYSQIELRIMAHLSGDEHLTAAFRDGLDVHKATAAKIYGIGIEDVTDDQRRVAKTANFGIMYGISAFGLAQRLGIPRNQAKSIIDDYFAAFPSIKSFISKTLEDARANGYTETVFGRRRYIPDINAKNATVRSLAERNAVNAPIQGTAADIIKIAMIRVAERLRKDGFRSKMVLQIHDELLFDGPESEAEALGKAVREEMENVVKLNVPLTVECNYGKNWLEAH